MGLRSRILKLVHPDNGGPRKRSVLEGSARSVFERENFARCLNLMLERRDLIMYGKRKGAKYGLPKGKA